MNWNLETYPAEIKINIEKQNPGQQTTLTTNVTSEFAGNVAYEHKNGLKFGLSAKVSKTSSYQIVTSLSNTNLGDVIVNFGDKVILDGPTTIPMFPLPFKLWKVREYDNNMYSIIVMPRRVQ